MKNTTVYETQKFAHQYAKQKEEINMKVMNFEYYAAIAIRVVAVLVGWMIC